MAVRRWPTARSRAATRARCTCSDGGIGGRAATWSRAYRTGATRRALDRHRALRRAAGAPGARDRARRGRAARSPRTRIPTSTSTRGSRQLDALAARAGGLLGRRAVDRCCSSTEGFRGNDSDYGDPRNSFLDDVLDRQLGIPITLSVLMLEVGRRCGLQLHGVGMPGHFLVGGGRRRVVRSVPRRRPPRPRRRARRCSRETHTGARFRPQFLMPVGPRAIVERMLAQPAAHLACSATRGPSCGSTRLRLRFPDITLSQRGDLAGLLGRLGQFAEAAREFDVLARARCPVRAASRRAAAAASSGRAPTDSPVGR